ncbi:MAG TPA: 3-methyl-2-oxobutanoate hydroxymethyltransferase [Abditibacterium sp.]|jgi:3-methyl-2-oxobutanoate hydroxymethyltransferase
MFPLQVFARKKRDGVPLCMVALSDAPSAQIACDAGIDAILVGDSLANTALGFDSTIPVTLEMMAHHVGAVVRGVKSSTRPDVPVIADMPFGSYASSERGVENAVRLMQIGAHAIKIEGTQQLERGDAASIFDLLHLAGIPVMGHIGFTPQSSFQFENVVQGKTASDAESLLKEALFLESKHCFGMVLEAMTQEVAQQISSRLRVSTIGIGAGMHCDGQVLVWHDLVGISAKNFKMARAFAQTRAVWTTALQEYKGAVENREFPGDENGWKMAPEQSETWAKRRAIDQKTHDAEPFADEIEPLDEQPF